MSTGGLQMVQSMTVAPGTPLSQELQGFLAGDGTTGSEGLEGAVYVAMGTTARLLEPEVRGMAANLAALNRPVLWKISNAELPGMLPRSPEMFINRLTNGITKLRCM